MLAWLVLANAVYFRGTWLDSGFDPSSPNGIFHAPTGDVSVPMMSSSQSNAGLWQGTGWNAAALDYAGGTNSMILLCHHAPEMVMHQTYIHQLTP